MEDGGWRMEDGGWRMEGWKDGWMTPEILLTRLERFALGVLSMTRPMLRSIETVDMARQLRRAGTGAYMNGRVRNFVCEA